MDYDIHDAGEPVFLLSLDGGGIRGISEAVVLHEIMKRLQKKLGLDELPKPCDHFHLIGGTSTGGLMAIMLGRLRMNTEEVIEEYERLAERVFHKKNRRLDFSFRERALEECIKETIEQREKAAHSSGMGKPHGTRMLDIHNHSDKGLTFVVAMQRGGDEDTPVLFRTYRSHEKPMDCEIWEAARATSAAPMIFKPASVRIDNETRSYIDAAVKWNNPSKIVLNEAKTHFGGDRSLGCLLSLGTGLRPHALDPNAKKSRWLSYNVGELKRMMTDFLTDPEEAHLELAARLSDCPDTYFRLSLPILPELGRVRIHEYKKMSALKEETKNYLKNPNVSDAVDKIVAILERKYRPKPITLRDACHVIDPSSALQATSHLGWLKDTKPSARYFTGRQDILQRMDEFLHERDPASSPRREVWLHGIGGVGKTQIAHRFADQFGDRFAPYIFRVDASARTTILHSIQGMASQIYPGQTEPVNPQVIISWLQNTDSSWLMVVDNYDSGDINISRYLPNSQKGNIIFTSRQSYMLPRTGQCFIEIHVEEMAVKDSVELLRRTADLGLDAEDTILEAEKLVQDLGCLPLAIDQAGSYIGSYGCTVQEYRKTLKKRLKDVRYQDAVSEKGVYASFDLAFDHFRHESQHSSTSASDYQCALQALHTFCFYQNDDLFLEILPITVMHLHQRGRFEEITPALHFNLLGPSETTSPHKEPAALASFLGMREDGTFDPWFLMRGMGVLLRFSLIRHHPERGLLHFSMHKLVHSWIRDRMTDNTFEVFHKTARNILFASIFSPINPSQERLYPRLLPHMKEVLAHNAKGVKYEDDTNFFHKTEMDRKYAAALSQSNQLEDSIGALRTILEERNRELGRDDPLALEVMLGLGKQYRALGRWDSASDMFLQVMERLDLCPDRLWASGAHNRVCLELAILYLIDLAFPIAEELANMVISRVSRGMGTQAQLLLAKQRLSLVYQYQLKWEAAELVAIEVYEGQMSRNPKGIVALRALRELSFIRTQLEGRRSVERDLTLVLERLETAYGHAHLETLFARADLGWALFKNNKLREASEMLEKVLPMAKASLGPKNPYTLAILFRLGRVKAELGETFEAASLLEECYHGRSEVLMDHHPAAIGTGVWLVSVLEEKGRKLERGRTETQFPKTSAEGDAWETNVGLVNRPYAELPFIFTLE